MDVAELRESLASNGITLHRFGIGEQQGGVGEMYAYDAQAASMGDHTTLQVAVIEQCLVARGEVFFGTNISTFTMQINYMRRAAGLDWDTTSRIVLPGPKLGKVCYYNDRDQDKMKAAKFVADVDYETTEACDPW